jgi:hypothetical protein
MIPARDLGVIHAWTSQHGLRHEAAPTVAIDT